jgi:acyl carrier protein
LINNNLSLTHSALEQWLREHLHAFEDFERSGAVSLEKLGMDSYRTIQLLRFVDSVLDIALPLTLIHQRVFHTPNTLLAFLCAASAEHALQARSEKME